MIRRTSILLLTLAAVAAAGRSRTPPGLGPHPAAPPHAYNRMVGDAAPRGQAGQWLRKYMNLPPVEQEKALASDPEFNQLPPERQQKLRQRLDRFNSLPPEEKERILHRMEAFENLTPEQQQRARELSQKWRELPEDRRRMVKRALRSLREMDAAERERVLNSDRFRSMFSDQERDLMRGLSELPLPPGPEHNTPGGGPPMGPPPDGQLF